MSPANHRHERVGEEKVTPNPHPKIKMYRKGKHHDYPTDLRTFAPILAHQPQTTKLKMDNEAETKTTRLTSEIIRCIARSLLASAEELERSLWHYSTPKEPSCSSSEYQDDALSL